MPLIHHTRKGAGSPAIVFVHGFGCARSDWDEQVAHFAPKHDTVAVDLGAHGTSPGGPEHAKIETHGADVAALMDHLNLGPSILVGHSMGCRVVLEAAQRQPARVKGLILVDGSRLGEAGSKAYEARAKAIADMGYAKFVTAAFAQMFGAEYDKAKAATIIKRAVDRKPEICGPLFVDIGRYDSEHMDRVLAATKVPLLAIQTTVTRADGKRMSIAKGETTPYLDLLRAKVAGARIENIPGIGHFPQLERVPETNALMEDFIKGLR
ncbi:MAG: alpha/beta fold hydrolase [Hyphomicrobiaceae bacterium]